MYNINKNVNKYIFINLLIMSIIIPSTKIDSKVLIWDLGNTLLGINKFGIAKEIGLKDFALYSLIDWHNPTKIHNHVFDILNCLGQEKKYNKNEHPTDQGRLLPALICKWLEGSIKGTEIWKESSLFIKNGRHSDMFACNRQKKLISKTLQVIFDPKILAKHMYGIKPALKILKKCANQCDSNGKSKHKLFILSNLDPETFKYLMQSNDGKKVFQYFDQENIIISGHIGLLKPDPNIYKYFLNKYKLNPKECILIDDQIENIKGAEKVGISGIHLENKNYQKLQNQLTNLNVI